jgi:V8-like Glu-specific endopeptidase
MKSKSIALIVLIATSINVFAQEEKSFDSMKLKLNKELAEGKMPPSLISKEKLIFNQNIKPSTPSYLGDQDVTVNVDQPIYTPVGDEIETNNLGNDPTIMKLMRKVSITTRPVGIPTEEQITGDFKKLDKNDPLVKDLINYSKSNDADECRELAKVANLISPLYGIYNDDLLSIFSQYKTLCGLYSIKDYKTVDISDIENRIVIFSKMIDNQTVYYCTGFILSDTTLITARHCMYPGSVGGGYKITVNNKEKSELSGLTLVDSACDYLHDNKRFNTEVSYQSCDYIFYKKNKLVSNYNYSNFPISDVNVSDRLIIVGYHYMNLSYEKYRSNRLGKPDPGWEKGIVVADSKSCMALDKRQVSYNNNLNSCFIHACQTTIGMSGSPVFVATNNKIKFTGLQIGTEQIDYATWYAMSDNCYQDSNLDDKTMNLAITTPITY